MYPLSASWLVAVSWWWFSLSLNETIKLIMYSGIHVARHQDHWKRSDDLDLWPPGVPASFFSLSLSFSLVLPFLMCEWCSWVLPLVSLFCPFSRSSWWRGGCIAQVVSVGRLEAVWDPLKLYSSYKFTMNMFVILIVHTVYLLCCTVLYTLHLLHVFLPWKRDLSSVALSSNSSVFIFFFYRGCYILYR